jgi:hypothetical protein
VRLASQPEVVLRTPGDRDVSTIPPAELAALAERVRTARPGVDRAELKRTVAGLAGSARYTKATDAILESALPLDPGGGVKGG